MGYYGEYDNLVRIGNRVGNAIYLYNMRKLVNKRTGHLIVSCCDKLWRLQRLKIHKCIAICKFICHFRYKKKKLKSLSVGLVATLYRCRRCKCCRKCSSHFSRWILCLPRYHWERKAIGFVYWASHVSMQF